MYCNLKPLKIIANMQQQNIIAFRRWEIGYLSLGYCVRALAAISFEQQISCIIWCYDIRVCVCVCCGRKLLTKKIGLLKFAAMKSSAWLLGHPAIRRALSSDASICLGLRFQTLSYVNEAELFDLYRFQIDQANRNFVSNLNSKIRVNKSNFALNFHPFFCVIAFPSIYRAHGDQSTYQLTNFCMTLTPTPLIIHISILMTDNICSFRSIHKANCFVVPFVDKLGRHTGCMGCRTDKVTY